jgi:tRNA pseudouridine55 synthase
MGRRNGNDIHGWLVLDKPQGITSNGALGRLKRLFNPKKVGHAGTLDPLATGVLPIAFGEATKTAAHVVDCEKSYRFTVRWGEERNTDDSEGEVTATSVERPSNDAIANALAPFQGTIRQVPPQFSAIKIEGERAYDLARDGHDVALAAREVVIRRFELLSSTGDESEFICDCGKGTYVRALARDLGRALGCYGHVSKLRRTRVGPFHETHAFSLESLDALAHSDGGLNALLRAVNPVETALDGILALAVTGEDAARLRQGQPILIRGATAPVFEGSAYATHRGALVAIGEIERGALHPVRVFNIPA